jgi:hypothetical protein
MGTQGIGKGLDDDALDPVWEAIEKAGLVIFLHPHYGVGSKAWGEKDNGHVLPLALGFPFETTTVSSYVSRADSCPMYCVFAGSNSPYSFWGLRSLSVPAFLSRPLRWCFAPTLLTPCLMHRP